MADLPVRAETSPIQGEAAASRDSGASRPDVCGVSFRRCVVSERRVRALRPLRRGLGRTGGSPAGRQIAPEHSMDPRAGEAALPVEKNIIDDAVYRGGERTA